MPAGTPGDGGHGFGRVVAQATNSASAQGLRVAAFGDVGLVQQPFGDDHMGQRRDHGHIGAGAQLQVIVGLDVGRLDQIDAARVDHDQLGARAQARFSCASQTPGGRRGVGADDQDHVGLFTDLKVWVPADCPGLAQAIAGGRVADAGAGIDVVVAEGGAHQLLHQIGFFVGAARGGDAADRVAPCLAWMRRNSLAA
jgi:hypothetical protein